MAAKATAGPGKGSNKRPSKLSRPGSASKSKNKTGAKPAPTQHKPKPIAASDRKKKPPHLRYTEKELNVPQLNGIRPVGVQKRPNMKKGKTFVDDKESMNTILAMVMAEKEGNIESKMMRARQMEEVREARRIEAEKRAQSKKQGLEDRKDDIRQSKKRKGSRPQNGKAHAPITVDNNAPRNAKKRVSFG